MIPQHSKKGIIENRENQSKTLQDVYAPAVMLSDSLETHHKLLVSCVQSDTMVHYLPTLVLSSSPIFGTANTLPGD
jgi:hypothetical protein